MSDDLEKKVKSLEKKNEELTRALSTIIAYRDRESWTHSTSEPSRMDEEHEAWERARKLVNKPRPPGPCTSFITVGERGATRCALREGHDGPHTAQVVKTQTW